MSEGGLFIVVGTGEATVPEPDMFEARARATVRYADPSSWITATAVAIAIQDIHASLAQSCHKIGMVAVSDEGPATTMAEVEAAAVTGFSSPLRYAASSPGTLVGVSCIAFGFRGPTLNFIMDPQDGVPIALTMCSAWLSRAVAQLMVLATFRGGGSSAPSARAVLLAPRGHSISGGVPTKSLIGWLGGSCPKDWVK